MMTKMNKRLGMAAAGAVLVGGGLYAWSSMTPARATFEPSRLATVEQDSPLERCNRFELPRAPQRRLAV